ncbi:MAG TPA: hypothetical protein VKE98_00015 [Gemmataceae bacterium]|nr:hypothetical protein [Gemmataceae bacterium]
MSFRLRVGILLVLTTLATGVMLAIPPLEQDKEYHQFADDRTFIGVPNAANVLSNIPFVIVGVLGLWFLMTPAAKEPGRSFVDPAERWPYAFFFLFIGLTGFGSAYYHARPDNDRLLWDRLPLAIAFMAFLAIMISERISRRAGTILFWPLVFLGAGSVVYWHQSEVHGAGDLRIYLLVQFYPLLAIPLMLWLFPPKYTRTADLFGALAAYLVAKLLELLDTQVYAQGGLMSGHTLKHLFAAVTPYLIYHMIKHRRAIE